MVTITTLLLFCISSVQCIRINNGQNTHNTDNKGTRVATTTQSTQNVQNPFEPKILTEFEFPSTEIKDHINKHSDEENREGAFPEVQIVVSPPSENMNKNSENSKSMKKGVKMFTLVKIFDLFEKYFILAYKYYPSENHELVTTTYALVYCDAQNSKKCEFKFILGKNSISQKKHNGKEWKGIMLWRLEHNGVYCSFISIKKQGLNKHETKFFCAPKDNKNNFFYSDNVQLKRDFKSSKVFDGHIYLSDTTPLTLEGPDDLNILKIKFPDFEFLKNSKSKIAFLDLLKTQNGTPETRIPISSAKYHHYSEGYLYTKITIQSIFMQEKDKIHIIAVQTPLGLPDYNPELGLSNNVAQYWVSTLKEVNTKTLYSSVDETTKFCQIKDCSFEVNNLKSRYINPLLFTYKMNHDMLNEKWKNKLSLGEKVKSEADSQFEYKLEEKEKIVKIYRKQKLVFKFDFLRGMNFVADLRETGSYIRYYSAQQCAPSTKWYSCKGYVKLFEIGKLVSKK